MRPLGPALRRRRFVFRRGIGIVRPNQPQGNHQRHDQNGEQAKLDHGIVENRFVFFHHFRQFGRENKNPPNYRDQSHDQEWAGLEHVLAKRNLHRVQDFGKDNNQQNAVEQHNDVVGQLSGKNVLAEENDFSDEQSSGDTGEQQTKSDVNSVFNQRKRKRQLFT